MRVVDVVALRVIGPGGESLVETMRLSAHEVEGEGLARRKKKGNLPGARRRPEEEVPETARRVLRDVLKIPERALTIAWDEVEALEEEMDENAAYPSLRSVCRKHVVSARVTTTDRTLLRQIGLVDAQVVLPGQKPLGEASAGHQQEQDPLGKRKQSVLSELPGGFNALSTSPRLPTFPSDGCVSKTSTAGTIPHAPGSRRDHTVTLRQRTQQGVVGAGVTGESPRARRPRENQMNSGSTASGPAEASVTSAPEEFVFFEQSPPMDSGQVRAVSHEGVSSRSDSDVEAGVTVDDLEVQTPEEAK